MANRTSGLSKILVTPFVITLFYIAIASNLFAKSPQEDLEKNRVYRTYCEEYKTYLLADRYDVECFHNYHHFNSSAHRRNYSVNRARQNRDINIGSLNLLHPGTARSAFKDYKLIAKMINEFDVLAAQELLAVVARDLQHNNAIVSFINDGPRLIQELEEQIRVNFQSQELRDRLRKLRNDLRIASTLYRAPGYLDLLHELQKLDGSWALILAPRGEASEPTNVQELTGFFYRASIVQPVRNPHCEEYPESEYQGHFYGCFPNFYQEFMGRNTAPAFSRRPFMASFKSGDLDLTLLTTHVIFTPPRGEEKIREVMQAAFGLDTHDSLGTGVNQSNFARWAEVKLTLEFMQNYERSYRNGKVLFVGDLNLESSNYFWSTAFESTFPGGVISIDTPTTLSQIRYRVSGVATNGVASNYDHFIFKPSQMPSCLGRDGKPRAEVYNFYNESVGLDIRRQFYVRDLRKDLENTDDDDDFNVPFTVDYDLIRGAERIINPYLLKYQRELESLKTVFNNEVVPEDYRIAQRVNTLKQRVFLDQLSNRTYYRIYQELLTDHLPIVLTCRTTN